jgi:flagellar biosynthesis/type III secretory pathway chaperone
MIGMELENHTAKQAYIQLMAETLKKKDVILNRLLELTQSQEEIISADPFNEDEFLQIIARKEDQIQTLTKLDTGFEQLYVSVGDELASGKEKYASDIAVLKEYIIRITDLSVRLQTMEKRNKAKLEVLLSTKRKNIKGARISNQTAANYYKTMAKQQEAQSYFYDKKK